MTCAHLIVVSTCAFTLWHASKLMMLRRYLENLQVVCSPQWWCWFKKECFLVLKCRVKRSLLHWSPLGWNPHTGNCVKLFYCLSVSLNRGINVKLNLNLLCTGNKFKSICKIQLYEDKFFLVTFSSLHFGFLIVFHSCLLCPLAQVRWVGLC